jgi:CcmD family protein
MSNLTWLFIAFSVVWLALGLYLYSLGARQRALERRLDALKQSEQRHNL